MTLRLATILGALVALGVAVGGWALADHGLRCAASGGSSSNTDDVPRTAIAIPEEPQIPQMDTDAENPKNLRESASSAVALDFLPPIRNPQSAISLAPVAIVKQPTEHQERERLAALAGTDAAAFDAQVRRLLADGQALQQSRVAALRVAYEAQGAAAMALFHDLLRNPGADEALRSWAARFLTERAGSDRAVWCLLADELCRDPSIPELLRRDLARATCRFAGADDGARLWALAVGSETPELAAGVLAGLSANDGEQAQWLRAWMAQHHGDAAIRTLAASPALSRDEEEDRE